MGLAPLIAAAAPIVGAAISAVGGAAANATNAKMTKKGYRWSRKMSNSQYQRGMRDMKKAGLNPILAYQKGGASYSSPSNIPAQNIAAGAEGAATNAASLYLQNKQTAANVANLDANTARTSEAINTEIASQNASNSAAAYNMAKTAKTTGVDTRLTESQISLVEDQSGLAYANAMRLKADIIKSDVLVKIRRGKTYAAVQWMVEHGLTAKNAGNLVRLLGRSTKK